MYLSDFCKKIKKKMYLYVNEIYFGEKKKGYFSFWLSLYDNL